MSKAKSEFLCESCGAVSPRWAGKCPDCQEWNTMVEHVVEEKGKHERASIVRNAKPIPVTDGATAPPARMRTGIAEMDRVLGGGIVPGSLTLVGGDPGIGKSTLMLQISQRIAESVGPVLYVSGEESFTQAQLRARRLGVATARLMILTETAVNAISRTIREGNFAFVVIDSIQSVYSPDVGAVPGSVSQVRECACEFLRVSKGEDVPIFLVGHVTKDGAIAGPRMLEHLVDTVLYFEGEGKQALRILRTTKNRFGSTNEIGVFEMRDTGLHEVANPSALFLNERPEGVSGSVVFPSIEGTRPLLVEVQALVGDAHAGSPRRTVTGMNPNRISLILAVLEKHAGLHFSDRDVFVNVAGGVKLDEPAADVAAALALVSSFRGVPVLEHVVAFGEIGLAGEIRAVDMARQRVAEAAKFGFQAGLVPKASARDIQQDGFEVWSVAAVADALPLAMEV
ncbi:MAG: DNA repair protein RadA [Candidatus Hydrogenedentes bacterium]|nr:DNA repair protein RadA [Candidatus Hydrogenedentota bacterium]